MKSSLLLFILIVKTSLCFAQDGLEGIIVEKYYISDSKDEKGSKKTLPKGSVTYRIFVDMKPKYRFQAAYGVPGHKLQIATTANIYNHEEHGADIANNVSNKDLMNNILMLDSWLSVCAGSSANFAVLKSSDTSEAIRNIDGLLQNTETTAGIPIKLRDGLIELSPVAVPTLFGIDSTQLSFFTKNKLSTSGQSFTTENGSWASFGGTLGLDTLNRVLIAQITTTGNLSFELNLQLGTPDGKIENYVARNPKGNERTHPGLIFQSASE